MLKKSRLSNKIFFIFLILTPISCVMAKSYFVTCATGELGRIISETLASEGHELTLGGRNLNKLHQLQKYLHAKYKAQSTIIKFDYTDLPSIHHCADQIKNHTYDGFVIITPRATFSAGELPSAHEWNNGIQAAYVGPMELIRSFALRFRPKGSLVIVSGLTSKMYMPSYPHSNVIKLMWSGAVKNLAHYFGGQMIRVNAISPGVILTPFNQQKIKDKAKQANKTYEKYKEEATNPIPLKRYGEPQEVANLISFLLSEKSSYLSGENIALDGGYSNAY